MLDQHELGEFIDGHFSSTLFRLETLRQYLVDADGEDYRRYVAGLPGPTMSRKGPWLETLRRERERGLHSSRVHVWQSPLSDYLRYECEWGYAYNADAGEDIRILDTAEQQKPDAVFDEDFWIIDDQILVRMYYKPEGEFLGASVADPELLPQYRAARNAAWSKAVPFADYWHAHPHYWRDAPAA